MHGSRDWYGSTAFFVLISHLREVYGIGRYNLQCFEKNIANGMRQMAEYCETGY
jgi:hypothetical protein